MKEMKLDIIKSIIDYKLARGQTLGAENVKLNKIISKKIQYTILNGEFKLFNVNSYL
jgi:hypothetical protein